MKPDTSLLPIFGKEVSGFLFFQGFYEGIEVGAAELPPSK
jgi:hypothetical protein